jgi:hypothetical protein
MLDKIVRIDIEDTAEYDAIVSQSRAARYTAMIVRRIGLLGRYNYIEAKSDDGDC